MSSLKLENKKIQVMGEYHYISIPKALIDHKILSPDKEYDIILKESKPNRKVESDQKLKVEESS